MLKFLQARNVVGISPVGSMTVRILFSAIVAGGAALVVRHVVDGWLASVLLGGVTIGVVYLAVLLTVACTPTTSRSPAGAPAPVPRTPGPTPSAGGASAGLTSPEGPGTALSSWKLVPNRTE